MLATAYVDTTVDGLNTEISAAIPELQAFADWAGDNDMPLHTILEGRSIGMSVSAMVDLRDFQVSGNVLHGQKVTLVIGQDWQYADTLYHLQLFRILFVVL